MILKTILKLNILLSMLFFLSNCNSESAKIGSLDRLNWSERNYEVLKQLIDEYGQYGQYYDEDKPPYVLLDWDQTCAFQDAEEALLHYQLSNLKFKLTKEQFREILHDTINGVTNLSEEFQHLPLAAIHQDLIQDYNFLFDNYIGLNGSLPLSEIQSTPQYKDFIVKIPYLYEGYCETPEIGAEYGYPWVLFLIAGYTIEEVKVIAKEAISLELGNRIEVQTWETTASFPVKSLVESYSFRTGLRILPEMQNLISTFKNHGIEVFIVSASFKPVIEVFSGIGTFGYNVPAENIIAMQLATNSEGVIMPYFKEGWVKTFRQGKVEAVNQVIKLGLGKNYDPLFAAGDSDGDFEMLTGFPQMKLGLIWNRVKGGDIGKLSQKAVDALTTPKPEYILQGRNENTGMSIPFSESILFGKTEMQLLHK